MNFLVLSLPYGFGALTIREFLIRWKKGWPSLLILGLAYGIFEEGIVVYSVFDPGWSELGTSPRSSILFRTQCLSSIKLISNLAEDSLAKASVIS